MRDKGLQPTPNEDEASILRWVRTAIPADTQPMQCVDVFASYVMFR
jgi:hypothetical protein